MQFLFLLTFVVTGFVVTVAALKLLQTQKDEEEKGVKVEHLVQQHLKGLVDEEEGEQVFAVRSSGLNEDSELHSFAGIYETYLNTPTSEVWNKVKECWASSRFDLVCKCHFLFYKCTEVREQKNTREIFRALQIALQWLSRRWWRQLQPVSYSPWIQSPTICKTSLQL